jgi:hypothetical protein
MDQKNGTAGGESCGTKSCCGSKALGAVALLLVGAAVGYFAGRKCTMCAAEKASMTAPATPAAPAAPAPAKKK